MLAMALFLEKYNRSMSNADRDKIEVIWLLNLFTTSKLELRT
jgi:hypothetical protein